MFKFVIQAVASNNHDSSQKIIADYIKAKPLQ